MEPSSPTQSSGPAHAPSSEPAAIPAEPGALSRRRFGFNGLLLAMAGALSASYGALALMAARFLYPARPAPRNWSFLVEVERMAPGESLPFRTPGGQVITVARTGRTGRVEDFVALSGTCPHLGCQVHWEAQNNRFFCPCHNGVFDASGRATAGPPAEARQSLGRFPLKIEGPMVFIELSEEGAITRLDSVPAGPPGAGHDPCLFRRPRGRA